MRKVVSLIHKFRWRSLAKKLFWSGAILLFFIGSWFLAAWMTPLPERLHVPCSVMINYQDGTPAHVFLAPDGRWRVRVSLDEIDPNYVQALLAIEDKRFSSHLGVDPIAVLRATKQNLRNGEIVSGASTITMQLVRVLEPRPRTFRSKIIESFRATQFEMQLTKEEILEAYLTFIPFGKNIEGVEAASLTYFGHRAKDLDADEIATLIAVPQNPNSRYPSFDNALRLERARNHIARLLHKQGKLPIEETEDITEAIFARSVPMDLLSFPRDIPHLAMWLIQRNREQERIETTIDPQIQKMVLHRLTEFKKTAEDWGVFNTSVLVVDKNSGEFRSMIGGFDFWSKRNGSQIPAFFSVRSSGSTLKPLIFAMAIDEGIATPDMLIEDIPVQFGSYIPENYNGEFDGLVSLDSSLSRSLNLPFINLLREIGLGQFLHNLRQLGVKSIDVNPLDLGLSAAVGVYLTPIELAHIYTALANAGRAKELQFLQNQSSKDAVQVFSPASMWLTHKALTRRDRPDFPLQKTYSASAKNIAWKTGTSMGHRDAWSAGWLDDYVVVVWLGNLNNDASSKLVGSSAASPLLFDILEQLSENVNNPPPPELISIDVCAYSGYVPDEACPLKKKSFARQDRVPVKPCPYHLFAEIDVETNLRVAPGCREDRTTKTISVQRLPSAVQRWMKNYSISIPPMAPGCEGLSPIVVRDGDLQISSPRIGQIALMIKGVPAEKQQIALIANYPDPNATLYWYIDGDFLGSAQAFDKFWWTPVAGKHQLEVRDTKNHSDKQILEIRQTW